MGDYIKRVNALKAATLAELDADFVIEAMRNIPAEDVRPVVRGHWIEHIEHDEETDCDVPYGFECSECGRWEQYKEPFCNCGAMMDERS